MTSIVSSTFNPRSYIYSSNSETLILQSATSEARLSFINSSYSNGDFRYLMSATAQKLSIESVLNNTTKPFQTYSAIDGVPSVETFGSIITSNIVFSPSSPNQNKLLIFQNGNTTSAKEFSGIGINTSTNAMEYYVSGSAYNVTSHIFYTALSANTSTPLMTMQANSVSGIPQIKIGIPSDTPISQSASLALAGDIQIEGNLIVQNINLNPNNIVYLDNASRRIASNLLPTGIVYATGSNNTIDPSLVPTTVTGAYFKTYKNFGLGTRNPVQQLHVQGSTYISERLGVGISVPANRLHVVEYAAGIPTAALYNTAGGDILHTYITSNTFSGIVNIPVLSVVGTHQGVGIGTSDVNISNALQVNGNIDTTSLSLRDITITNSVNSTLKIINLRDSNLIPLIQYNNNTFDNVLNIYPQTTFTSNCIFYGQTTVYNFINTQSDIRAKYDIQKITNSLEKVNSINGYTYCLTSEKYTPSLNNKYAGVIAQEIQNILPEAVYVSPSQGGMMSVKYDSLIPLLIESIKELTTKVNNLELRLANQT